jgi:hypothetical protein
MNLILVAFLSGLLFAAGLGLSLMTLQEKVIGFLDLFGAWDPTLMFVMIGAIPVYMVFHRLALRMNQPVVSDVFHWPEKKVIDGRLIIGSALFGVGWGLGGFCPGPALVSLPSGTYSVFIFVLSLMLGVFIAHRLLNVIHNG